MDNLPEAVTTRISLFRIYVYICIYIIYTHTTDRDMNRNGPFTLSRHDENFSVQNICIHIYIYTNSTDVHI